MDRARTPAPDLPSLLLENRIVYLGMPLVPAVTELIIAELLYLQYRDRKKPIFMYVNSTGATRADGETVGACARAVAPVDILAHPEPHLLHQALKPRALQSTTR